MHCKNKKQSIKLHELRSCLIVFKKKVRIKKMIKKDCLNEDLVIIGDCNGYGKRIVTTLSMQDYFWIIKILEIVMTVYKYNHTVDCIYKSVPENTTERYMRCVLKNIFGEDAKGNILYPNSIEELRIVNDKGCFRIV